MSQVAAQTSPFVMSRGPAEDLAKSRNLLWSYGAIAFCLVHIPLALLAHWSGVFSTLHALAALGVGVWFAISAPHRPLRVAYVAAYITGAEVLWRMTNSYVFWEFGKYGISAIFLIAIVRRGRLKCPVTMLAFFALLIPSVPIVVVRLGFDAEGYISFFLSGPLAMTVAAWFFSQQRLSVEDIQRLFLAAVGPIIGIASIAFFAVYTAKDLVYTGESNRVASAGFGPNQVSAALGLGVLLALMVVVLGKTSFALKLTMLGGILLMAAQSALTFSRGGLYNVAGSVAFASVYLLREARTRRMLVFVALIVFVIGSYVILPRLEDVSGGMLTSRFSDTQSTNRVQIALDELKVWRENPILGTGPGGSLFAGAVTAHTEFFRFPAEHGIFGVVALVLLLVAAVKNIQKSQTLKSKAIAVCLIGWSFLYMLNAAMRLVAPSFAFGLAFATILPETKLSPQALRLALNVLSARLQQIRRQRLLRQRSGALGRIPGPNLQ